MKPSSSRVSREAGVIPRSSLLARAALGGAFGGEAGKAVRGGNALQAGEFSLRVTRRSGSMRAVPHTSGPTPRITSTPNYALQRTGAAVTAHAARLLRPPPPSPAQPSRQPPPSLSLGSLGHSSRLPLMKASASLFRVGSFQSRGAFGVSVSVSPVTPSFGRWSVRSRLTLPRLSPCLHSMRFVDASFGSQVTRQSPVSSAVIGRRLAMLSTEAEWPNHALQRTGAAVTPAASATAFPPTVQRSRQPRRSLSLRSLGVSTRIESWEA